ncbi:STAS domain-containing protein [Streptomyces sp. NPDC012693]|jgi:anti-anti-sigma factor|uniref:STAS domain-containing protein n=1 Tax=unclassified Streptomyces TaxID=2593676 RepID=UPI00202F5E9C|nr:STAS domain-containing protein [Streptomyces sp. MSC1_001]
MVDEERMEQGEGYLTGRFEVDVRPVPGGEAVVLVLAGELDRDGVEPLREALEQGDGSGRFIVDCSGLGFCDSSGLNVLLRARMRIVEAGGRLDLAGLRPPVDRMFDITGARDVFQVYESADEALSAPGHEGGGRHVRER